MIPDTIDPGDTWQVAATYVENGTQLVFVDEFSPGNPFDQYTGRSGIAVMSIPADGMPTLSSVTLVPTGPDTQWGSAATQSGGYNYIYGNYGNVPAGMFLAMKVARVPLNQTLNFSSWQYWNGSGWVSGEANAVPISTINQFTGVTPQQDGVGYVAVSTAPSVYAEQRRTCPTPARPKVRGPTRCLSIPFPRSTNIRMRSRICLRSTPSSQAGGA